MNRVQTQVEILTLDLNNPNDRLKLHAIEKLEVTHQAINEFKSILEREKFSIVPDNESGQGVPVESQVERFISELKNKYTETFSKHGIAV